MILTAKVRPNVKEGGEPDFSAAAVQALMFKHVPARNPEISCDVMFNHINGILRIEIQPIQPSDSPQTIKAKCKQELEGRPEFMQWIGEQD